MDDSSDDAGSDLSGNGFADPVCDDPSESLEATATYDVIKSNNVELCAVAQALQRGRRHFSEALWLVKDVEKSWRDSDLRRDDVAEGTVVVQTDAGVTAFDLDLAKVYRAGAVRGHAARS